jgi:hypothetical protein
VRIGELVRELDKAQREGPAGEYKLPNAGKSKADAITDAGLSRSQAYRARTVTRIAIHCG